MSDSVGGAPLYLAPGWMCDREIFAEQVAALGLSDASYVENRLDDDLGAMADRLLESAPERFAIAGFSMGGMLAVELMARAPERLAGAALICTEAEAASEKEVAWRAHLATEADEGGDEALEARREWMLGRFAGHSAAAAARMRQRILAMNARTDLKTYLRQNAALSGRRNRLEALRAFAVSGGEIIIIAGSEDKLCPKPRQKAMKEAAPDAPLIMIKDCGHLAPWEKPEIVSAALRGWLAAL